MSALPTSKEEEIMSFLTERVFNPILDSPDASIKLKGGCRLTMNRMRRLDAAGMIQYYWLAMIGTGRSIGFGAQMKREDFDRFEEVLEDFRIRFPP